MFFINLYVLSYDKSDMILINRCKIWSGRYIDFIFGYLVLKEVLGFLSIARQELL